ncbi:hypothetical protein OAK61_01670 [Gammaproteobacteria bacterium]|nr:hypothetical protein [Gammaproteobacteria bacterium]
MKNNPLTFLEASQLIREAEQLAEREISILTSSSLYQIEIYLRAYAVKRAFNLNITTLDFGTLKQALYEERYYKDPILILLPWDFLGSLDWRTGISNTPMNLNEAKDEIDHFSDLVRKITNSKIFYLDAIVPPITNHREELNEIKRHISFSADRLDAVFFDPKFFCFKTYLSNGCPFSSNSLSLIANKLIESINFEKSS